MNHLSKITDEQICEIRKLALSGELSQRKISAMYGITQGRVYQIKMGQTYRSVVDTPEKRRRHREIQNRSNRKYYAKNRAARIEYGRQRKLHLYRTDPHFAVKVRLRSAFYKSIRRYGYGKKSASILSLIGCSVAHLMKHLESKFTIGMSWKNRSAWHIDHIHPCSRFDLTNPEEQKKCFHFSNLQPLWKLDNISKGNRIDPVEFATEIA